MQRTHWGYNTTVEAHPLAQNSYFTRVVVALLLGVAIGLEREWRQRMAGIHTTAMVAIGAAIFTMIAPLLEAKGTDPTRIAAQVVSGIGFLAGGVILRQGANVRGLTTAATLWATAAVGVLVGFGFLTQAVAAAFLIIVANVVLYPLTHLLDSVKRNTRDVVTTYTLEIACRADAESQVREQIVDLAGNTGLTLLSIKSSDAGDSSVLERVELTRVGRDNRTIERLTKNLKGVTGVASTQWRASEDYR